MARVYFDISGITGIGNWKEKGELGLNRVLYGSDRAIPGNSRREYWTRFRDLPFSAAEFKTVEANLPPYIK